MEKPTIKVRIISAKQMKYSFKISALLNIPLILLLIGCTNPIERSGIVIDKQTKEPLHNVSIEIYMKTQKKDSLKEKVFTNSDGHFHIKEKRDEGQLFTLYKDGYTGFTSTLSKANDTITLEKEITN